MKLTIEVNTDDLSYADQDLLEGLAALLNRDAPSPAPTPAKPPKKDPKPSAKKKEPVIEETLPVDDGVGDEAEDLPTEAITPKKEPKTSGKPAKAEKAKAEPKTEPVAATQPSSNGKLTAEMVRDAFTKAAVKIGARPACDKLEELAGVRKVSLITEEHFQTVFDMMTALQ